MGLDDGIWSLVVSCNLTLLTTDNVEAPLRVHIAVKDDANASWPLEPYVEVDGGLPAGTLVIPVHPSQISDQNLKSRYCKLA